MTDRNRGSRGTLLPEVLERLIMDRLSSYGEDAARVRRIPHDDGITEFIVTPRRASAAPIAVATENDGTRSYLTIGQGSPMELDGRPGGDDLFRDIVEAVLSGRFEETVRTRDSEVLSAYGRLTLPHRVLKLWYGRLWSTFPFEFLVRSKKLVYRYEAYA